MIRPLHDVVYVAPVVREKTKGGLYLAQTFDDGGNPDRRLAAKSDLFEVRILAVGPEVRDLAAGDRAFVWTFANDMSNSLYTGEGESDGGLFIRESDVAFSAPWDAEIEVGS